MDIGQLAMQLQPIQQDNAWMVYPIAIAGFGGFGAAALGNKMRHMAQTQRYRRLGLGIELAGYASIASSFAMAWMTYVN